MTSTETNLVPVSPHLPQPSSRIRWFIGVTLASTGLTFLLVFLSIFIGASTGMIVFGGLFMAMLGFYNRRRLQRMLLINQDAATLLAKGQVSKAQQMFLELYQKSRFFPHLQALFLHNYGTANLRMGDFDKAHEYYQKALSSGWLKRNSLFSANFYPQICIGWTMLHGLRGELEAAYTWLEQAKQNPSEAQRAEVVSVEMLVWARSGNWDRVIQTYEQNYAEVKDLLSAPGLRRLYLLRAFAEEQQKGSSYREVASELTSQLRDASSTEFAFLTTEWPELRAFVTQLGFLQPQLSASQASSGNTSLETRYPQNKLLGTSTD